MQKKGDDGNSKKGQLRAVRLREQLRKVHGGKTNPNVKTPPVTIQVLGNGSKHSPASLMVIAGNSRCGDVAFFS